MKISKIVKLSSLAIQLPIYFSSFFIEKRDDIWVFGSWKGQLYNDNSKYFFEYIVDEKKDIKAFWIAKNRGLYKELKSNGKPVLYCYSPKGIYIQLKAGACFFTQSHRLDLLGSAVGRNTLLVQLWHGMPLKKILNDDAAHKTQEKSIFNTILNKVFPWTIDKWDMVTSPSTKAEAVFRSAFGDEIKIINSGFPRNVNFLKETTKPAHRIKNIIYMPTFRGYSLSKESNLFIEKYFAKNNFDYELINQICKNNDIIFNIKLHPTNNISRFLKEKLRKLSNINYIESNFDFYEEANNFDLLITDYSSVFFDFVLTGKPLLHVAFDLQEYILESRDLYFNYNDISIGKDFSDWLEVFNFIVSMDFNELKELSSYKKVFSLMDANEVNSCAVIHDEAVSYLNKNV